MTNITAPERTADELLEAIQYVIINMPENEVCDQFRAMARRSRFETICSVLVRDSAQEIFDAVESHKIATEQAKEKRMRDDINAVIKAYSAEKVLQVVNEEVHRAMNEMKVKTEEQT